MHLALRTFIILQFFNLMLFLFLEFANCIIIAYVKLYLIVVICNLRAARFSVFTVCRNPLLNKVDYYYL